MFGVSPAFVVSLCGKQFSIKDFCQALELVKDMNFSGFQPEIYLREALPDWFSSGAAAVSDKARALGLQATQFVAHFMMEGFSTPQTIESASLEDLKQVIEIAGQFDNCKVLTVPVGPFSIPWDRIEGMNAAWASDIRKRFVEKIGKYLELVKASGLVLALEILPLSLVGGTAGFLEICHELNSPDLGINLDTGHAWACREIVPLLPFMLHDRVFGLHLCDNLGTENLSLAPGKGSIEWKPFLTNLFNSGYRGSLDIEIACEARNVRSEYAAGLEYINSLVTV
jgi:sugar phosphate isomerase/epimerase